MNNAKKNNMHKIKISMILVNALISICIIKAQDINKEVFVVRPYEPTLSDASKYSFMPSVSNIETTIPQFQYSVTPKRLENNFEPDPIKAARTVTTSLSKIYNSWLKLGLGNYTTGLAEFNISNLRSKEYAYGIYLRHKSSRGKIRLENDDKVNSGYAENNINIYGKRFFKETTLWGNLLFDHNVFNFYGYNTDVFLLSPAVDKDSLKHSNFKPGIEFGIKSTYDDKSKLNFDISGNFEYFRDKLENKETELKINTSFSKDFYGLLGGLNIGLDNSHLNAKTDTFSNTIFKFNPWISKFSEDWNFKLGFEAVADIGNITKYYFYPQANLDIIIVKDVLVPFVGISGEIKKNSYQNLFKENMFIKPGLSLKNTSNNFTFYGGIKGNISSVVRFRADVKLSVFKDYYFFVNDTVTDTPLLPLNNQFTAVYDDINIITYHGQLVISPKEKFEFMVDANYYSYKMFKEAKPWHKPDFDLTIEANYKFSPKFVLGTGFGITGNRWVNDYDYADNIKKIKPVFDANVSLNYNYSKLLTIFADFYNLTERSYLLWNQYPSQRFNFMFGFKYKL